MNNLEEIIRNVAVVVDFGKKNINNNLQKRWQIKFLRNYKYEGFFLYSNKVPMC